MPETMVFSTNEVPWHEMRGASGYESKALVSDDPSYTDAYSCELVHVSPTGHSDQHKEPWNHTLFFIRGKGEIVINGQRWPVAEGSVAKVKAGDVHFLTNEGPGDMLLLAIYDPPRPRDEKE
jgi:quercetin dioxygenase-like cupin family protein